MQPSAPLIASLREIARALSAAWDLDHTLELISRKTTQVMQVDSCSIYLLEPETAMLWLRASTGLSWKAVGRGGLKMGEGLTGWAAQHNQAVAVREAQTDPRFKLVPYTNEKTFHSLLAVPLVNRDRVIGAMNVQTVTPHTFTSEQIELLTLIGDLAAGAIDRAILYDHMERQITELTTLAKVSETVTSPLYLDEMLELIVEMAAKVMGAPVCVLRLIDQAQHALVVRAAQSRLPRYSKKPPVKLGEGLYGRVMRERKPIATVDVRLAPEYPFRQQARAEGLASMLAVPLIVREQVIGVLSCYTTAPHTYTDAEIALFSTLANQTALATENAQFATNAAVIREMHHRIKNNLQTVAMLLRLQASASTIHTVPEVLHQSVNRVLSIAAVHEVLAHEGFHWVNIKDMLDRIARLTAQSMVRPDQPVQIVVAGEALVLPSKPATALALAVNELLQNALEHAFVGRAAGHIHITLRHTLRAGIIEVHDDGIGLPDQPKSSLGLGIVETLVRDDLRGHWRFKGGPTGTCVTLRFPRRQTLL
jgi:signal transduction protein with GAF and PtsI domain